jgi:hypothetical protein
MSIPKKLYLDDPGYREVMTNGKPYTYNFKNVFITDKAVDGHWNVFIPFRVFKETEEDDMLLAKILTESVEKYHEEQATKAKKTIRPKAK